MKSNDFIVVYMDIGGGGILFKVRDRISGRQFVQLVYIGGFRYIYVF